jgi:hypothetical protein
LYCHSRERFVDPAADLEPAAEGVAELGLIEMTVSIEPLDEYEDTVVDGTDRRCGVSPSAPLKFDPAAEGVPELRLVEIYLLTEPLHEQEYRSVEAPRCHAPWPRRRTVIIN